MPYTPIRRPAIAAPSHSHTILSSRPDMHHTNDMDTANPLPQLPSDIWAKIARHILQHHWRKTFCSLRGTCRHLRATTNSLSTRLMLSDFHTFNLGSLSTASRNFSAVKEVCLVLTKCPGPLPYSPSVSDCLEQLFWSLGPLAYNITSCSILCPADHKSANSSSPCTGLRLLPPSITSLNLLNISWEASAPFLTHLTRLQQLTHGLARDAHWAKTEHMASFTKPQSLSHSRHPLPINALHSLTRLPSLNVLRGVEIAAEPHMLAVAAMSTLTQLHLHLPFDVRSNYLEYEALMYSSSALTALQNLQQLRLMSYHWQQAPMWLSSLTKLTNVEFALCSGSRLDLVQILCALSRLQHLSFNHTLWSDALFPDACMTFKCFPQLTTFCQTWSRPLSYQGLAKMLATTGHDLSLVLPATRHIRLGLLSNTKETKMAVSDTQCLAGLRDLDVELAFLSTEQVLLIANAHPRLQKLHLRIMPDVDSGLVSLDELVDAVRVLQAALPTTKCTFQCRVNLTTWQGKARDMSAEYAAVVVRMLQELGRSGMIQGLHLGPNELIASRGYIEGFLAAISGFQGLDDLTLMCGGVPRNAAGVQLVKEVADSLQVLRQLGSVRSVVLDVGAQHYQVMYERALKLAQAGLPIVVTVGSECRC